MSAFRLQTGGMIDRNKPLSFHFDGKAISGFEGDTIASALLANDVKIVARSFKYHRPRGIWGHGSEEPNALIDVIGHAGRAPNEKATVVQALNGLECRSVNSAPSAADDRKGWIDRFSRFIPAAFYYKTFMFPHWSRFDSSIRAMAGLGRIDPEFRSSKLAAQKNIHPDLLVVGMGPAGLIGALKAARAGKKVVLVDEKWQPGGSLLHRDEQAFIDGMQARRWLVHAVDELERLGALVLTGTTAFGIYDHGLAGLNQRHAEGGPDTLWRVRAKDIVLATGAIERPLPFANNDLPGIMSADAALYYLRVNAVVAGREIVIVSNNSSTLEVAHAFAQAGAKVEHIINVRIEEALGRDHVEGVRLKDGRRLSCDCLLVSGGFTPTIHLYAQAKGKLAWDDSVQAFVPGTDVEGVTVTGAAAGRLTLQSIAHLDNVSNTGEAFTISPEWPEPGKKGRVWIDFQNDVTVKDVELAARENFTSVEHLKRYTTLGMATDQGKTSNINGLALMAALSGKSISEVGTTTYRPPFTPVPLASFAGKRAGILYNLVKRLPLENVHTADGAIFQEYGGWLRPAWFGDGPLEQAIDREVKGAREHVALFDGSTLGKIEVIGPQAAEFLDFIFYNTVSTLKPGRCRYAFILTESGVVYDDGVLVRLAEDRFVVSCSSSHVAGVYSLLEDWRQDRFDRDKVFIHNATAHWATLTVTGPKSRALLQSTEIKADLSDESLPHMAIMDAEYRNMPIRVARVSFTGDRSYEISVRADRASELWAHLKTCGAAHSAILLGSEALLVMRAEKGYIITGKDTDGLTRPSDLGLDGPLKNKKVEFIGRRSLLGEDAQRKNRQQYVGLEVIGGGRLLPPGAHGVERNGKNQRSIGYVTSSYMSPTLGKPIAMGLIERGRARHGEVIDIRHFGEMMQARIVDPCFFDSTGERLHA